MAKRNRRQVDSTDNLESKNEKRSTRRNPALKAETPQRKRRKVKTATTTHSKQKAIPTTNGLDANKKKSKRTIRKTPSEEKPEPPAGSCSYWLMKAEPESRIEKGVDVKFSIDDLAAATEPEGWDGVRNFVARNNMRAMRKGDLAFFYHSNCKIPGIAGMMEIVKEHSPDKNALDPNHPYYDPKDSVENPKWSLVHVEHRQTFPRLISLKELQKYKAPGEKLENMQTMKQSRLSVSKVSKSEWDFILGLLDHDAEE